jgi:hypothetical protein
MFEYLVAVQLHYKGTLSELISYVSGTAEQKRRVRKLERKITRYGSTLGRLLTKKNMNYSKEEEKDLYPRS